MAVAGSGALCSGHEFHWVPSATAAGRRVQAQLQSWKKGQASAKATETAGVQPRKAGEAAIGEIPKQPPRAFFRKIPLVQACHSKQALGLSYSPTFPPDQILSGSRSLMAQLFSLLQVSPSSPVSLVMTQLPSTVSAGAHHPCAFATSSLFAPATSSIQVHPDASQTSLFGRGESC